MLNIDSSQPIVRPSEVEALVRAVLGALPEDESVWLEWKSTLDLGTKHGRYTLARAVIGMANRDPLEASRYADGNGFVVVGAEPGNLVGVPAVESHVLEQQLAHYLGRDGPRWHLHNVPVNGRNVLVVIVPAPKAGDLTYWLENSFHPEKGRGGADGGTIFVRRQSSTEVANSAEQLILRRRMLAGNAEPALDVHLDVVAGASVPVVGWTPEDVEGWLRSREQRLLASLPRQDPQYPTPGATYVSTPLQAHSSSFGAVFGAREEERTEDDYRSEVAEHLERCRESIKGAVLASYADAELGVIDFVLRNPTETSFPGVEVEVHLAGAVHKSKRSADNQRSLPRKPRPFGEPQPVTPPWATSMHAVPYSPLDQLQDLHVRFHAEDTGSVTATYGPWDLRARQTLTLDGLRVWAGERPDNDVVRCEWRATSMGAKGVAEGTVDVPLGDDLGLSDLLMP